MDDERELLDIQQQLARAWVERDRAFIERVLAPEWSVTQADGSILTRANVLRSAFETDGLRVKSIVVDEVAVRLFGTTAVVRGRTAATGTDKDLAFNVRMRFTDVFLKRDGEWQAVASHASLV
jgi:ketosteroid isomerase-like protein